MKESAGTLLYRTGEREVEVLLVHPSGTYNRHRPWGIPKGIPEAGETLEKAAVRETWEETGIVAGKLHPLGSIEYKSGRKRVHCFVGVAGEADPKCASWEVDRAEFVPLSLARSLIHPDQSTFLDRFESWLRCAAIASPDVSHPAAASLP